MKIFKLKLMVIFLLITNSLFVSAGEQAKIKAKANILLLNKDGVPIKNATVNGTCKVRENDSFFAASIENKYTCTSNDRGICSFEYETFAAQPGKLNPCTDSHNSKITEDGKEPEWLLKFVFSTEQGQNESFVRFTLLEKIVQFARVKSLSDLTTAENGVINKWPIGEGPLLKDLIKAEPKSVQSISVVDPKVSLIRGKFETDAEFKERSSLNGAAYFLTTKVQTNNPSRCDVKYIHDNNAYSIKNCIIFSPSDYLLKERVSGSPLVLSNAFDRREVRRSLINEYSVIANFVWNADFKISRVEAEKLDDDLEAGVLFEGITINSRCSLCESRDRQDATRGILDSINSINGIMNKPKTIPNAGWMDDAFKNGEIIEDWIYTIRPLSIKRYVVFRKSDTKVLFDVRLQ